MAHGTKTFLVTGGCGFIGSHLAEALLASGHRVRILDDLSSGKRGNAPLRAELHVGSICDADALSRAIDGVDGVFHLAAIASVHLCVEAWEQSTRVNLLGSVAVFEACAERGAPVVYASSAAVYGDGEPPARRSDRAAPLSAYGADKYAMELHAAAGARTRNLRSFGVRFFNIYGPRQDPASPYSGVIAIFQRRIADGKGITIFGDGRQTRDFVYVEDAVRACLAGMERAAAAPEPVSEVENVCHGTGVSLHELATGLGAALERRVRATHAEARPGDIRHSRGEPSTLLRSLGAEPRIPLKEGLARLVAAEGQEAPPMRYAASGAAVQKERASVSLD